MNVVDLFKLVPHTEHPHGMTDREFEALFTSTKPVVFNFHSYPWLIHRLTYRRPGQHNIHVRGYKEKGNINTPLELAIRNQTDRFSLAIDAIDRIPRFRETGSGVREALLERADRVPESRSTNSAWIGRTSLTGSGPAKHGGTGGQSRRYQMGNEFATTVQAMMQAGKGLLAMDESNPTCNKRFAKRGIPQTVEARRLWRELILTTSGLGEFLGGAILYDETIRQSTHDGTPFIDLLTRAGIVPGIKVDAGAKDMAGHPGEKVTEGLDGLRQRLSEYHQMGARFAKWRAVITIGEGIPSRACIEANAHALARYAALCQEAGLVPIVEPEVLMDGSHTLEQCAAITEATLHEVFGQLYRQRVRFRRHDSEAQHGTPRQGLSQTGQRGGRGGRDGRQPAPRRAGVGPWHCVPFRAARPLKSPRRT